MTIRDEISKLIADLGITRYRAAKLGGVTATHLYLFLKTGRGMSVHRLDQLRNALTQTETEDK